MGADEATRAVLKDLAREPDLFRADEDIKRARAAYERAFSAWTAVALRPTREDWIELPSNVSGASALVVEPAREARQRGAVVFIHGGGWSLGSAISYAPLCRLLASESGLRVVAPDFPQAPENPYPAALNMLRAAVAETARRYGGPILMAGDSAGGTLAAVLSVDPSVDASIAAQALFYPVLDLRPDTRYRSRRRFGAGRHFLTEEGILGASAWYCGEEADPRSPHVSPILNTELSRAPATCLLIPDLDPLRDECELYAQRLRKCGVQVEIFRAKRTVHGCASFSGRIPQGLEGVKKCARFLSDYADDANA